MKVIGVQDYLEKSGDTEILDGNTETDKDKGFCIWRVQKDTLVLIQVYGDGSHWNQWATNKAKELELTTISFGTRLDPEIFHKHGFEVVGYIMQRGV